MLSSLISTELRKFCETTSVRGIPRIVNSKSTLQFVTWLIGVLTCVGILTWQLVVIFRRYQSYSINTLFVPSPDGDNTTFPDITICNLSPLVHEREFNLSYSDYLLTFNNEYNITNFQKLYLSISNEDTSSLMAEYYESIYQYLVSPTAYFLNFPVKRYFLRTDQAISILGCSYFNWDYSPNTSFNCSASIGVIWDSDFYKCYSLSLYDSQRKIVRGFSAVLHYDKFIDNVWMPYNLNLRSTRATGMQVLASAPGTLPDMQLGIAISPGMSSTIVLSQNKRTRLPYPYSNCTSQTTLGLLDNSTAYTQSYCIDVCLQEMYLRECGCILSTLQFTNAQLTKSNNTMCGSVGIVTTNSSFNWNGIKQILCSYFVSKDQSECNSKCLTPCVEYQYSASLTATPWPDVSSLYSFYATYIDNTALNSIEFQEFNTEANLNFLNKTAAVDLLQKLDRDRLIQDNFLQLNIQFATNGYNEEKDVIAFTLDAFGAQIGGVLSLWLGITIVLIFEMFDVFINVLVAVFCAKRNQEKLEKKTVVTRL